MRADETGHGSRIFGIALDRVRFGGYVSAPRVLGLDRTNYHLSPPLVAKLLEQLVARKWLPQPALLGDPYHTDGTREALKRKLGA